MNSFQRTRASVAVALVIAMAIAGCTKGPVTKVDPSGTRDLRAARGFVRVLQEAIVQGTTLENTLAVDPNIISPELHQRFLTELPLAKASADEVATFLNSIDTLDSTGRQRVLDFADRSLAFLQRLNDEGVLRIKNPGSQVKAQAILSGARLVIVGFQITMGARPEVQ